MQTQSIMPMREYWQDIEKSTHSSFKKHLIKQNLSSDMRIGSDSTPAVLSEKMPPDEGNATKGVIRLLQEGHFKGVAEVRLRINFMDEINALENDALTGIAEQGVDDVIASVKNIVDDFMARSEASDEKQSAIAHLQDMFANDVTDSFAELQAEDVVSAEKVTEILTASFNSLTESLKALLSTTGSENPGAAESAAIQDSSIDSAEVEVLESFFSNLNAAFADALDKLESDMNSFSVLPPLSEPEGNGKAYDKFLVVYQDLMSSGNTPSEAMETAAVDIYL